MKAPKNTKTSLVKNAHDASLASKVTKANAEEILLEMAPTYLKSRDKKQEYESKMQTARDLGFIALDLLVGKDKPHIYEIPYKGKAILFGRYQVGGKPGDPIVSPERLQELLTDEQWNLITDRVLNEEKLAQAVSGGLISEGLVSKASEIPPVTPPSLRVLAKYKGEKLTKTEILAPILPLPVKK